MTYYDYIIIGGGVAGTTAAFTIRNNDKTSSILIIGNESYHLYSRVILGSYLYDKTSYDKLFLKKLDQYAQANIATLFGTEVAWINFESKQLSFKDKPEAVGYNKLLIATGGRPRPLTIPGHEKQGVFSFQYMDDTLKSKQFITEKQKMVVIGGGFIGIEFVDIFKKLDKQLHMVIRDNYYWQNMLLAEGGHIVQDYIQKSSTLMAQEEVVEILGQQDVIEAVRLKSGKIIECDTLFCGIGLMLNTDFLDKTQIKTDRGILVNSYLETSQKDIFAAGDVAQVFDPRTGNFRGYGVWASAALQGSVVGNNMTLGTQKQFSLTASYSPKIELPINFVGETILAPGVEAKIIKNDSTGYIQVCVRDNAVIGAVLINNPGTIGKAMNWIKNRVAIEEVEL